MTRLKPIVVVVLLVAIAIASVSLALRVSVSVAASIIDAAGTGEWHDDAGNRLRIVGGTVRNRGAGWAQVGGNHDSLGLGTVRCSTSGYLNITVTPAAGLVVASSVTTDETLSRRGVIAGASVGSGYISIRFTQMTSSGPRALSCRSPVLQGDAANVWIQAVYEN